MADPTVPSASRRFASLLDREFCFWMPSPSVALLSVLVTAKERPKRLLGPEDLPAFASNIGRVAGAATLAVTPASIDEVLHGLMDDGLTPGQVWGVALHREGKLSPTDWLSSCANLKAPTVELCLGSLATLAQWGRSPATFTIVDLDAEAPFAGVRLTALLTSDRGLAARVQHLCLPGPEAREYILDANPRGLAQDEPDLLSIVDDAAARFGGKSPDSGALPGRALAWLRRFTSLDGASNPPAAESAGAPGLPRWSARLAEIEAHHSEVLRSATAFADSLKARLEQQSTIAAEWERRCLEAETTAAARAQHDGAALAERQRTIDLWESRFNDAEAEAEKDAAVLSGVRVAAAKQRSELEGALASLQAERDALERDLGRMKEEHALALRNAEASELRVVTELRRRIGDLEAAAAASADREVKEALAAESMRARLQAQVDRLEAGTAAATAERAALSSSLAALKGEREALEQTLARTKEEHAQAVKKTASSELEIATGLRRRIQELEDAAAASADRAAKQAETAESGLTALQTALASMKAERDALAQRILKTERDHALGLRNAAASEMRITIELRQRIKELEEAAAASTGREAKEKQAAETERAGLQKALAATKGERDGLAQKIARMEQDQVLALRNAAAAEMRVTIELRQRVKELEDAASAARETGAALLKAKTEAERSLAASEEERKALARKLVDLDAELGEALAEAARRSADQRGTLEEQNRRASRLEAEVATLTAREAEKAALLGRLSEAESKGERVAAQAAERERAVQAALEAQRTRVEELEASAAALEDREAKGIAEERSSKAALAEQVRRLEADAVLVQQSFAAFRDEKKAVDRALTQARTEALDATEKLAAAEAARAEAILDAERRTETSRAALEDKERLTQQAHAWATEKTELFGRLTRLEAQVVEAQEGRTPLQSELGVLREKLAAAEAARDAALLDAERRGETLRAALEEQTQRLEQSRKDTAVLNVREARQAEAFSAERADLSDRIARLEAMTLQSEEAHESALAEKTLMAQEIAVIKAERAAVAKQLAETEMARDIALAAAKRREEAQRVRAEELEQRAETVRREAEAAAQREARQTEAREASRADLVVRIARLEAAEVASEKARSELLDRKRETDRSLAAAQAEIATLVTRLAAAGSAPDRPAAATAPAPSPDPENGAKPVNTGGFSSLLSVLQTSVIQRPPRTGAAERPPDSDLNRPFEFEANPAPKPAPSRPAQAAEPVDKGPDAAPEQVSGGFSALLSRLTGRTPRPRPTPPPDESQKLDGWLRDRKRGKD